MQMDAIRQEKVAISPEALDKLIVLSKAFGNCYNHPQALQNGPFVNSFSTRTSIYDIAYVYIIYIYENKLYIYIYDLGLCCHENL
jgi:hypothetical protein